MRVYFVFFAHCDRGQEQQHHLLGFRSKCRVFFSGAAINPQQSITVHFFLPLTCAEHFWADLMWYIIKHVFRNLSVCCLTNDRARGVVV